MQFKVGQICTSVEGTVYEIYGKKGRKIESMLQEVYATLERISKLEGELHDFKKALGMLYQEVHPAQ